jgi:hypothetical protein
VASKPLQNRYAPVRNRLKAVLRSASVLLDDSRHFAPWWGTHVISSDVQGDGLSATDDRVVRLKPEIPLSEGQHLISDQNLSGVTDLLAHAATMITRLKEQNKQLERHMDEMAAEFQDRVLDLQEKLTACKSELELRTHEAERARKWLQSLSSGIMEHLGDVPSKLGQLAAETRAADAVLSAEVASTAGSTVLPELAIIAGN